MCSARLIVEDDSIKKDRRVQRLRLDPPLPARLGGAGAKLVDISLYGAGVEHHVALNTGSAVKLVIEGSPPLEVKGTVTRCEIGLQRGVTVYRSGIAFRHSKQTLPPQLKELMARELYKAIALWKANARGTLPETLESMPIFRSDDDFVSSHRPRKRATSFVWYRFVGGAWNVSVTFDPNQPLDGFAVSADDDQSEMEQLRTTYEIADEAGRELIRLLAHLSIIETRS